MDMNTKSGNDLSEEYLISCQMLELIGDIERCALSLVTAAQKAKEGCEKSKNRLRQKEISN